MSEWISVKEGLPDAGEMVLVNVDRYSPSVTVGERDCGKWVLVCGIGTINDIDYESNPTHWMPLPPSPNSQLTVKEALGHAIEFLEMLAYYIEDGGKNVTYEQVDLAYKVDLPRLRAALEEA